MLLGFDFMCYISFTVFKAYFEWSLVIRTPHQKDWNNFDFSMLPVEI